MATRIKVFGREAVLTADGWRSGDPDLDRSIELTEQTTPRAYHPNDEEGRALSLVAHMGGKVLEVEPLPEEPDAPPGRIY